jgi:hypothetical protein
MSPTDANRLQTYARAAGVLFLISLIFGFFGEWYAPSRIIVSGDAAATAKNLHAFGSMFRVGFATYMVEAICDTILSLVFYVLLRPVDRNLALLAAFFGLISTTLFAVGELFYFVPSLLFSSNAGYLNSFTPEQINSLSLLSLKIYALASGIFMAFYGTALVLRGYLIFRSDYLPKFLGALMMLAGAAFIFQNATLVLAPRLVSDVALAPVFIMGIAIVVWMLAKGVDTSKLQALQTT